MKQHFDWKLKDILMICIVSVLFALVYLGANYVGTALVGVLTPFGLGSLGYQFIYGIYFMAASFAAYVIQKKGVAVVAEILASVIEVLLGSMFGPMVFITGLVQGIGIELGFLATGYRKFNWFSLTLGSIFCSLCSFAWNYVMYGYSVIAPGMLLAMFAIRTISSVIFAAGLTKAMADGLARAGVLRGYALGMKQGAQLDD